MSDSSNSRAAKLVGESYFFTEPTKVIQFADQAFGPISTLVEEDQPPSFELRFRLGAKMSLVNAANKAKAFAICSGNVLVQPQTGNANKVNLILRPFKQPFQGMPVKYFIYRGLDSTGFVTTTTINDQSVFILANSGASPFIQEVREDYESLNGTIGSNAIRSSWIGFDLGNPPYTGLIDDLFFRISPPADDLDPVNAKDDELPFVKGGLELGEFNGDFQLDIVLGSPDYKQVVSSTGFYYDIDFARAADGILDIANCPPNYPVKAYREAILDFIDPAAFWGMHIINGGSVISPASEIPNRRFGSDIFNSLLLSFHSKNTIYIYLKGRLNRSYSYYDNANLGISRNHVSTFEAPCATHSWPFISLQYSSEETLPIEIVNISFLENSAGLLFFEQSGCMNSSENPFCLATKETNTNNSSISFSHSLISTETAMVSSSLLLNFKYYESFLIANGDNGFFLAMGDKDLLLKTLLSNLINEFGSSFSTATAIQEIILRIGSSGFFCNHASYSLSHFKPESSVDSVVICSLWPTSNNPLIRNKQNDRNFYDFVSNSRKSIPQNVFIKFLKNNYSLILVSNNDSNILCLRRAQPLESNDNGLGLFLLSSEWISLQEKILNFSDGLIHGIGLMPYSVNTEFEEDKILEIFKIAFIYESSSLQLLYREADIDFLIYSIDGSVFSTAASAQLLHFNLN